MNRFSLLFVKRSFNTNSGDDKKKKKILQCACNKHILNEDETERALILKNVTPQYKKKKKPEINT